MSHNEELVFAKEHAKWHEEIEAERSATYGPLSQSGLYWLSEHPESFKDIPGVWSATKDGFVKVNFRASEGVIHNNKPAVGELYLGPFTGADSEFVEWGSTQIQIAARFGRTMVRPHNPETANRIHYPGTDTFAPDLSWVITAEYIPNMRKNVEVPSAIPGKKHYYDSPGSALFEINGQAMRLTLFGEDDSLRAHFTDLTKEDSTFAHVRFVEVTRLNAHRLVIDFNRAVNPPAAYSMFATCPYTPPENHLTVRIEAGEKRPQQAV